MFLEIQEKAVAWNVGIVSPEVIDKITILQATYEAMRQAVRGLKVAPDLLLNDAVTIPDLDISQVPIIKGGRQKCFHRGGQYPGQSYQGPYDGPV